MPLKLVRAQNLCWKRLVSPSQTQLSYTETKWEPPPLAFFKVNSDASLVSKACTGIGAVIRDAQGHLVASISQKLDRKYPIDVAEALACRAGVRCAVELNLEGVIIEMDCQPLTNGLRRNPIDITSMGIL